MLLTLLYIFFRETDEVWTVLDPTPMKPCLQQPAYLVNPSLLKILLVYCAEKWNIDAEYIVLYFILINHWPPDSPWSTFDSLCLTG